MPFVDFAELKTRVSIEQAAQMLQLTLTAHGKPAAVRRQIRRYSGLRQR
jgi:hypothetical protein